MSTSPCKDWDDEWCDRRQELVFIGRHLDEAGTTGMLNFDALTLRPRLQSAVCWTSVFSPTMSTWDRKSCSFVRNAPHPLGQNTKPRRADLVPAKHADLQIVCSSIFETQLMLSCVQRPNTRQEFCNQTQRADSRMLTASSRFACFTVQNVLPLAQDGLLPENA